jgi:hypothetical protein
MILFDLKENWKEKKQGIRIIFKKDSDSYNKHGGFDCIDPVENILGYDIDQTSNIIIDNGFWYEYKKEDIEKIEFYDLEDNNENLLEEYKE